jgi:predicted metal-dependent hydrolase
MAILLQGIEYKLSIRKYPGKVPKVFLRDSYFEVCINRNSTIEDSRTAIEQALVSWLLRKAEEVIDERLKYYRDIVGVSYNRFCIKAQKTRWGSCSSKGNLNFNWRLIMAPQWVLDYVIVHELSHLRHMNHSKEFWNTVANYMPEYKKAVAWLKENGGSLKLQLEKEEGL